MPLTILIAEDDRDVANVVAYGARMNWPDCRVLIAADGAAALQQFHAQSPDLVVLDVVLPPPDGYELCERIRATSQVPILMLTVRDAPIDKVRALDLGADDYLTKPFNHLELLARLRALVRRSLATSETAPSSFVSGELAINFASHEVRVRDELISLTSTEYRLLEALVRQAGAVLSHDTLLEQVWGPEYARETHYLKVFVRRLRQKLGDDAEQPRFIQTVWGNGYRFIPPQGDPAPD
jgi:DNA-binding response OmpR family regulator